MKRTDRLLAIVLILQAKKWVRAEDLADHFEVSKRTIYRDMLALDEAGIPIIAIPGQGFSLVEGYFLPPLSFSTDEAIMLLLGADFVAQNFDDVYREAAHTASQKITAVLPEQLRAEVDYLQSSIRFIATHGTSSPTTLQTLRRAIIQHKTVQFNYYARYGQRASDAPTQREVDPYALVHIGGDWMLTGYCHLRQAERNFRLNRMEKLTTLNQVFKRPADFQIELNDDDLRPIVARVLFDAESSRRMQEMPSGYQVAQEDHTDGLLVTLTIHQDEDILSWLLSWGRHVRVLEPESLREKLASEAEKILLNHQK